MRSASHVCVGAGASAVVVAGLLAGPRASVAVALACGVAALAGSLPGRAPDGLLIGAGLPLVTMVAFAHPDRLAPPVALAAVLTVIVCVRVRVLATPLHGYAHLGGFWLGPPVAVAIAVPTVLRPGPVAAALIGACLITAVFALVVAAATGRGRDLTVGVVAGMLWAVAALLIVRGGDFLTAAFTGRGGLLGYPGELLGLTGVVAAGRIASDRAHTARQRAGALALAAVLLVAAGSAIAYAAALIAALAHLVSTLRRRSAFRPRADRWPLAALPLVTVGILIAVSARLGLRTVPALRRRPVGAGLIPYPMSGGLVVSLLAAAALLTGAGLVGWRVTGPGLPRWIPVVGLGCLVAVLAGGLVGSPAWVLLCGAEVWVRCHGLRADRDIEPPVPVFGTRSW